MPKPISIVSACMRRDGLPAFVITDVEVTEDQAENGHHYDLAEEKLLKDGYEEPFVHFGPEEAPEFLHPAVRQHLAAAVV